MAVIDPMSRVAVGQRANAEPSDALVFFGATGALVHKKIFPALQHVIRHGRLDVPVIGVAKSGWTLDQLRARAHDSLMQHGGGVDQAAFAKLVQLLQYVGSDYQDPATFTMLRRYLYCQPPTQLLFTENGTNFQRLFGSPNASPYVKDAFHCVTLALVDFEFAKAQLTLILREWYMHPNGQIPAYEWACDDVDPPVHAWAALSLLDYTHNQDEAAIRLCNDHRHAV